MSQINISDLDFIRTASSTNVHGSGHFSNLYSTSYSVDRAWGYTIEGPYHGYSVNRQDGSYVAFVAGGYSAGISSAVAAAIAVNGVASTHTDTTVWTF